MIRSDGRVDAASYQAMNRLNRLQYARAAKARTVARILSILDSHKTDSDIQHRFSAIMNDTAALKQEPMLGNQSINNATSVLDPSTIGMLETNLKYFETAGPPQGLSLQNLLEVYSLQLVNRHNHRTKLSSTASSSTPQK